MSWYSDNEPFDEFDPPYCKNCHSGKGGNSKSECDRCMKWHEEPEEDEEEAMREWCEAEAQRYMAEHFDENGDPYRDFLGNPWK